MVSHKGRPRRVPMQVFDEIITDEEKSLVEANVGSKRNDDFGKDKIVAMYLTSDGQSLDTIEQALSAYEKVSKEYTVGEIKALGRLCNKENPITFAEIISMDYMIVQLVFLEHLGELRDELEQLSEDELKNLIVLKLSNEKDRKRAKERLFIER